jgi:HprK-related kinase B
MSRSAAPGLYLRFGSFTLAVQSNDARLQRRLARYFRDFALDTPGARAPDAILRATDGEPPTIERALQPWGDRGKESFADTRRGRIIRKDRTGVVIETGAGWTIAGNLHRNFSQLVNLIGVIYGCAQLDRGGAMLHASAAVIDGAALAMIGESGSGKSSLTVRLLERGADFLSNDRLIVRRERNGVVARGLPKLPRVNPGTLLAGRRTSALITTDARRRYGKMGARQLWDLEEKFDLDFERTLGRRWLLRAPLACAFVLDWRHGGGDLALARLTPGQAVESLQRAAKSFGAFDLRLAERTEKAYRDMARGVPIVRVTGAIDPTGLAQRIAAEGWQALAGTAARRSAQPSKR